MFICSALVYTTYIYMHLTRTYVYWKWLFPVFEMGSKRLRLYVFDNSLWAKKLLLRVWNR